MIVISYGSRRLLDCCSSALAAEEALGPAYAPAVLSLIAEAEALETAAELLRLYGNSAKVEMDDSLLVAVGANCSVRFTVVGAQNRRDGAGRVVWDSVQRLKLVAIVRC